MRKGARTRLQILESTAPLFNRQGYFGASLADVMQVTGLKKGGIYNHFESKEELALEAFDYAFEQVSRRFMDNLRDKSGAVERLLGTVEFFRLQAVDPPVPGGCPVLNTAIESDDAHPALRERARNAMNEWRELIQRIVQKGIERGEINPEADPDKVASILISTLEGSVMLSRLYRDPIHMYRAVDHLTEYIQNELALRPA